MRDDGDDGAWLFDVQPFVEPLEVVVATSDGAFVGD